MRNSGNALSWRSVEVRAEREAAADATRSWSCTAAGMPLPATLPPNVASPENKADRRRAERVPVNEEFRDAGTMFVGDLSEQGVFLHCARPVRVGSEIAVRFTVLLEEPVVLTAHGRVVRVQKDPRGMGIAFTTLDSETKLKLYEVVSRRRPLDSGPPVAVEFAAGSSEREEQG